MECLFGYRLIIGNVYLDSYKIAMRNEEAFESFVMDYYRVLLADTDLKIDKRKNILTDVTCIFEDGKFELIHGFSETDIAIYQEITVEGISKKGGLIKFYGDSEIWKGNLAVPYVILEIKTGQVTTDAIRCRDFVAARIKSIFPFTAYYLLAESTTKEEKTLLRQGKSFTNYFISKDEFDKKYLKDIFDNHIGPYIKNLKRQFKILSE